jgi:microsomal dipeptidase-like Zn-dependent dipeptidase
VAATGGVVGVNGLNRFLGDGAAKVESMVAHIDHMAKLVGAEHGGIGLDYEPSSGPGLDDATSAKFWPARGEASAMAKEAPGIRRSIADMNQRCVLLTVRRQNEQPVQRIDAYGRFE